MFVTSDAGAYSGLWDMRGVEIDEFGYTYPYGKPDDDFVGPVVREPSNCYWRVFWEERLGFSEGGLRGVELLADIIMELIPDVFTEFLSEGCFRFVRERVENPVLQKILCVLAVLIPVTLGVLLAFGVLCLIGVNFG